MREKTKNRLLKMRDGIRGRLRLLILAFLDYFSLCLFIKSKPDQSTDVPLRIIRSQEPSKPSTNPSSDEPSDNGPTTTENSSPSFWSRFKQYMSDLELRPLILDLCGCFFCVSSCWTFLLVHKLKPGERTNTALRIIRS